MFKPVISNPDFPSLEREILEKWKRNGISEKYRNKNQNSDKKFRFLDGPITANNPMGVHHAHGRTLKDFFQRYFTMNGYKQRYQNGFDCQGLWVEVEVEKDLGFNSKRDIEKFGIENFSNACKARVEKFSAIQAQQSERLGMFMDWDNSYYTLSENNNLHIWHFLKECHSRGWIYKGVDSMPWCTRCGTAISQHELSDGGYQTLRHESVYAKFPLKEREKEYLLIWTTTPWTLAANVAVAVNPNLSYVKIKLGTGEIMYLAKARIAVIDEPYEIVEELNGAALVGLEYSGPFDELPAVQAISHKVVAWEDVGEAEGTGLVHIAPGAGHEDFELGKKENLGLLAPLDEFGNHLEGYGEFSGKSAREVKNQVFESLKHKNIFYKSEWIEHSYPCCWRCKEELVFRTTSQWFIKVTPEFRNEIREVNKTVNWMPESAKKRMDDWLMNMGDWPISRQRYWGLALPFYECGCGEFIVVGSKDELKELALEPEKVDTLPELHRPWIDEIKITCPKCQEVVSRIKDVGDCWLDAGIVPFSTVNYLKDPTQWNEWYPFDFITEYFSQIKLWFYATLFMSTVLKHQAPWKNVLATGYIVDEKGEPMHKSKGNAIWFDDAVDKMGADVMRWIYLSSPASRGDTKLPFGFNLANDVRRRFHLILWNVYKFFVTYASLDGWEAETAISSTYKNTALDTWILKKLDETVRTVSNSIEAHDSVTATKELENFVINDLSTWYIRLIRDRVGPTADNSEGKNTVYKTLYRVLVTLSEVLAPFMPYMTDDMYQNLTGKESVHLADWPVLPGGLETDALMSNMHTVRQIVELGHGLRKEKGVKVRQPLSKATYRYPGEKLPQELEEIIKKELNVKSVNFDGTTSEAKVDLDFKLTEELRKEGLVREIIRQIQSLRKELGCKFDDLVTVYYQAPALIVEVIKTNESEIMKETLVKTLIQEQKADITAVEITLDNQQVWLGIEHAE